MAPAKAGSAGAYLCRRCKNAGKLTQAVTRMLTDKARPTFREPLCAKHVKEVEKANATR